MARYRHLGGANHWRLQVLPVCSSTALLLSQWLHEQPHQAFFDDNVLLVIISTAIVLAEDGY